MCLKLSPQANTTHSNAMGNGHILATDIENEFKVNDLNRMLTHMRRLSTSWSGHTPAGGDAYGLTDLFVSPEVKEMIRAFAYQPMWQSASSDANSVTALPDNVREDIYRAAGTNEIYGVRITDLLELGDGKKYNTLLNGFLTTAQKASTTGVGHGC